VTLWNFDIQDPWGSLKGGDDVMMCRNAVQWLYRLEKNYAWDSPLRVSEDLVFQDDKNKVRLIIEANGKLTVMKGYTWNGCSPKFCLLDLCMGTPDGVVYEKTGRPKTYYASLVHDALYQFLRKGTPIKRRKADKCFLLLMGKSEFLWRYVYWVAVRLFGWLVWGGKQVVRKWRGEVVPAKAFMP